MPRQSKAAIDKFLSSTRIAFIGLSRNPKDFSRSLFREFVEHGYEMLPVSPHMTEAEGRPCSKSVTEIAPAPDAALVMTPASAAVEIVRECASAGVKRVWLFRATGRGAVSEEAVSVCQAAGIEVIAGECPFMFLSAHRFPHNVHGWVKKLTFAYPR